MAEEDPASGRREKHQPVSLFGTGHPGRRASAEDDLRLGRDLFADPYPIALFNPARVWESLNAVSLDATLLAGNNLFTQPDQSPAGPAFDILRTRVAQAMQQNGWHRLGVTSPTHGCGKSFTAANLALALGRRPGSRTVLIDLDLRRPRLHTLFGLSPNGALRDFLDGSQPMESLFVRVGHSFALGLNAEPMADAGDMLHSPETAAALDALAVQLEPDLVLLDLPPVLFTDDAIAMADKMDAVLLVVDGTRTTAREIRACEKLFEGRVPILGVVLNRSDERGLGKLHYGKK